MKIEEIIINKTAEAIQTLYNTPIDSSSVQITKTKKEFEEKKKDLS